MSSTDYWSVFIRENIEPGDLNTIEITNNSHTPTLTPDLLNSLSTPTIKLNVYIQNNKIYLDIDNTPPNRGRQLVGKLHINKK